MSLADVLKADLEDDDEDLDEQQLATDHIEDVAMDDEQMLEQTQCKFNPNESVRAIAKLSDSWHLHEIVAKILDYQRNPRKATDLIVGQVEQDPE
jgi:hypothetical protein